MNSYSSKWLQYKSGTIEYGHSSLVKGTSLRSGLSDTDSELFGWLRKLVIKDSNVNTLPLRSEKEPLIHCTSVITTS